MSAAAADKLSHKMVGESADAFAGLAGWVGRLLAATAIIFAWVALAALLLAMFLPYRGQELALDGGYWKLRHTLATITILYYLASIPLMLLPVRGVDRLNWFLYAAYGWSACLLGSIWYLQASGLLQWSAVTEGALARWDAQLAGNRLHATAALCFLLPMLAAVLGGKNDNQRVTGMLVFGLGWALLHGAALAISSRGLPLTAGSTLQFLQLETLADRVLFLLLCLLYGLMGMALTLPTNAKARGEFAGLTLLLWLFMGIGAICLFLRENAVEINGGAGLEVFRAFVATVTIAPLLGFLAMPWTKANRWAWALLLLLALEQVIVILHAYSSGDGSLVDHIFSNFNGPRLGIYLRR